MFVVLCEISLIYIYMAVKKRPIMPVNPKKYKVVVKFKDLVFDDIVAGSKAVAEEKALGRFDKKVLSRERVHVKSIATKVLGKYKR